jgi:hypothetical protein
MIRSLSALDLGTLLGISERTLRGWEEERQWSATPERGTFALSQSIALPDAAEPRAKVPGMELFRRSPGRVPGESRKEFSEVTCQTRNLSSASFANC